MSIKKAILMLTVVSLLLAGISFAAKEAGKVPAPTAFQVLTPGDTTDPDTVEFSWIPTAPGPGQLAAIKFSVDVEGLVTYTIDPLDGDPLAPVVDAEVEVSFGTSDRTDGDEMGDPWLTITFDELAAAIVEALELELLPGDQVSLSLTEASGKVKGLNPGKDNGRQNNDFSNSDDFENMPIELVYTEPTPAP